ncbi:hypothetical protein Tco_1000991, partial [Tanacetum coccineum]
MPDLSESIDSNLVFDILGHMLLFERRVFSNKAKKLKHKSSLGKAVQGKVAQGKAAQGKAAKGKTTKGKVGKGKAAKRKATKQNFMGQKDKKVVKKSMLRLVDDLAAWDDFLGFGYWNRSPTFCHSWSKESEVIPSYEILLNFADGFTRDDGPDSYAGQDGSGALDRAKDSYEARSSPAENEGPFPTDDNAKATSVRDDVRVPDAATNDNAKAMSVHDDVGVHDAAIDDNAKAMSVCDDIDEADAAADDNAK